MNAIENRIPPPVVVLIIGAAMWLIDHNTPPMAVAYRWRFGLAASVCAIGLLIGGSGIFAFRRAGTTIDPVNLEAASTLVTTGIFAKSRNPMYVGFTLLLTAWALFLSAPWAWFGVGAFVLFTWRFQILPEERVMRAKFGKPYEEYQQRVRRWL